MLNKLKQKKNQQLLREKEAKREERKREHLWGKQILVICKNNSVWNKMTEENVVKLGQCHWQKKWKKKEIAVGDANFVSEKFSYTIFLIIFFFWEENIIVSPNFEKC